MTPEKILIIDDNPANIGLLSEPLERKGYEILTASDGDSGLRIASLAKPCIDSPRRDDAPSGWHGDLSEAEDVRGDPGTSQ